MGLLRAKAARFLVASAIGLAGAGCAASPDVENLEGEESVGVARAAIQGGFADVGDLGVVGVGVTDEDGSLVKTCSGVLVAPNLVLTAQHCVASAAKYVSCDDASFGPPVPAYEVYVTTDVSMWDSSTTWLTSVEVLVPPGVGVCGGDVALVRLADPVDGVKPLAPRLQAPCEADESYTAIGYGADDGEGQGAGLRRRRDGLRVLCVGTDCDTNEIDGREWRGDHGICSGDSGSPAIDRDGRVFGITSRGPSGCDDPVYGGLVAHRDWMLASAAHVADVSGLAAPGWAEDGATGANRAELATTAWSSCAFEPGGATPARAWLLPLGAIALAAALRRRHGARRLG